MSGGLPTSLIAIGSRTRNMKNYRKGVDYTCVLEIISEQKNGNETFPVIISKEKKNETVLNML